MTFIQWFIIFIDVMIILRIVLLFNSRKKLVFPRVETILQHCVFTLGTLYYVLSMISHNLLYFGILLYWVYIFARLLGWIYKTLTKDEEDYQAFLAWF